MPGWAQPSAVAAESTNPFGPWAPSTSPTTSAFGAAVVAALFLLLHGYRRKRFILRWTLGWLVLATGQGLVALDYAVRPLGLAMLRLSRFFGTVAILLLVLGADTYYERR